MSGGRPVRFVLHGASGRMGRQVLEALPQAPDVQLVGALASPASPHLGCDAAEVHGMAAVGVLLRPGLGAAVGAAEADVVLDFSCPEGLRRLLPQAAERGLAVVSGTTGLGAEEEAALEEAAQQVPVLHAANFSLGVAALARLLEAACRWLPDFDVEVFELHHAGKADAPSGTAFRLLDAVTAARGPERVRPRTERSGRIGPRRRGEVGLLAARGGDVPGEHTAMLLGAGERLEIVHRAGSRAIFARGALRAVRWVATRPAGRYRIEDVLGLV